MAVYVIAYPRAELIYGGLIPTCEDPACRSWIKPDIIFFGEGLPERFGRLVREVCWRGVLGLLCECCCVSIAAERGVFGWLCECCCVLTAAERGVFGWQ